MIKNNPVHLDFIYIFFFTCNLVVNEPHIKLLNLSEITDHENSFSWSISTSTLQKLGKWTISVSPFLFSFCRTE